MKKGIVIARCSTNENKQDVTRQSLDLKNKYEGIYDLKHSNAFIEYYKSGTKNDAENNAVIDLCIKNKIDTIIVSEISRISRRMLKALQFIERCNELKINVIISTQNLHTLNDDKTENQIAKMLIGLLSSFAEMELEQTKQRLNSGLKKFIAEGGKVGRKKGVKATKEEFLHKNKKIVDCFNEGLSVRRTAKITEKSTTTVQKVFQAIKYNAY